MLQPDRPEMRRKHVTVQQEAPVVFSDGREGQGRGREVEMRWKSVCVQSRVSGGVCVSRCKVFPLCAVSSVAADVR